MRRCRSKRSLKALKSVTKASGTIVDRQNSVSQKDGEIDEPYPALPLERNGADLVVVDEIGNQKKNRACEGSEHARLCALMFLDLMKKISRNQENGAE